MQKYLQSAKVQTCKNEGPYGIEMVTDQPNWTEFGQVHLCVVVYNNCIAACKLSWNSGGVLYKPNCTIQLNLVKTS